MYGARVRRPGAPREELPPLEGSVIHCAHLQGPGEPREELYSLEGNVVHGAHV